MDSTDSTLKEKDLKDLSSDETIDKASDKNSNKVASKTKNVFVARCFEVLKSIHFTVPVWVYAVLFVLIDALIVFVIQLGVRRSGRVGMTSSAAGKYFYIFTKMWKNLNFVFLLNMLIVACIYGLILMIINRFWVTSMLMFALAVVIAVIEYMKVNVRYETVLPADLNFLKSNTGNIATFLPDNAPTVITQAVLCIFISLLITVALHMFDSRRGKVFYFKNWRYCILSRIVISIMLLSGLSWYISGVGTVDSSANKFARYFGDSAAMWDSVYDAQRNGALVAFLRQINPKIMDQPAQYSQETMEAVYKRYKQEAKEINRLRTESMKDNTVVYILSESFSDPSRVPGVSVNKNPIPFITDVKNRTDSGLMLSSGYGGGTANLEYMSLTGLSMVNFDSSLTSPYQQLVPNASWTPTVNRYWGDKSNSVAFHPYEPSMYLRSTNYKKFGFSKFYALQGPDVIQHKDMIDKSPYVSDDAAYTSALDEISSAKKSQFVQIVTMQNHMPYRNWYANNDFKVQASEGSQDLGDDETSSIETYSKGINYTDQATKKFLDSLDNLDKPVTVVFYGDHLPGIYSTASDDDKNSLALHLTDYFIWSNKKSCELKDESKNNAEDGKENKQNNQYKTGVYSSPNFFIAQVAEHMNAKVSPYLAFLTRLHENISAMEPPVVNSIQGWDRIPAGQPIYLDSKGNPMAVADMDKKTRDLLEDYRLIQYDITCGKHYLKNTDFLNIPS